MKRREFIAGLASAAAWPMATDAQTRDTVRRIAWVGTMGEDTVTFAQELARLGWVEGLDVRVAYRVETDDRQLRLVAP
jgi:hypothetical protein